MADFNSDDEDESLFRLSEQARKRSQRQFLSDQLLPYEDDDDDVVEEVDDNEEEEDYLEEEEEEPDHQEEDEEDDDEDEDDQDDEDDDFGDDPRAEFLRAINSFGGNGQGGSQAPTLSFADMILRLMGDGGMYGRNNSEIESLIGNIDQREDMYIIQESLNELSEKLLMMDAITAGRVIPSNKLSRSIVNILNDPLLQDHLELQLVACRCLYSLMEVNLDFIQDTINNNAIEAICKKIDEITLIDLTEQALQTLEMISRDPISHNQIVSNNGLKSCLQYLDFLTIHSQRKCLLIVANSCTNISTGNFEMINNVFDNISEVVATRTDPNIIENAWLSISRIINSFKSSPKNLEQLFVTRVDLLKQFVATIVVSTNKSSDDSHKVPVSFGTCISLVKSLIILTSTSVSISEILVKDIEIGKSIIKAINKFSRTKSMSESSLQTIKSISSIDNVSVEAIMAAPNEILTQFLTLIGYLLPINYSAQETPFLKNSHEEFPEKIKINEERIKSCRSQIPEKFWEFVNEIWSFLINSFQALMDFEVRRKILISLFRIVKFMEADDYKKVRGIELVSGVLASIINNNKTSLIRDFESFSSSQQDTDMRTSDEEPSSDEENANDTNNSNKVTDNSTKLHSNLLLLSSCLISMNLIKIEPATFIHTFEREGLLSDILNINQILKHGDTNDQTSKDYESSRPLISSYTNRFTDIEFTKDYEFKLTSIRVYNKLYHILDTIEEMYYDSKNNEESLNSAAAEFVNETEFYLNNHDPLGLSFSEWQLFWSKFSVVLDDGKDSVSSFELISSGIIRLLTSIFSVDELSSPGSFCLNAFISVFYRNTSEGNSIISVLVSKLQEALSRSESFEIISAGSNTSSNNGLRFSGSFLESYQTAEMARQIKIKIHLDDLNSDSGRFPSSMNDMVLSVHAIATFSSVNTFLVQRLDFMDALTGARRRPSGSNRELTMDPFDDIDTDDDDDAFDINLRRGSFKHDKVRKVEFLIDGEVVPNQTTIYGAIYRSLQTEPDEIVEPAKVWNNIHKVTYRLVEGEPENEINQLPFYNDSANYNELKTYDKTTTSILKLLKILFDTNLYVRTLDLEPLPQDQFMSWKLSVKLNRQLEEILIVASGTLPGWAIHITKQFPFLFPLDTRIFFLQSTSFGYSRLIHQWQIRNNQAQENNASNHNSQRPQLGRPVRRKVKISRKLILQSALKVMNSYGSSPGVLEIEYFDEVGSGLGPTLEFYSSVSKEFSRRKLRLWRDDNSNGNEEDFIDYRTGLFPVPMDKYQIESENGKKILYLFSMLGKFVARALLDSRIIDFKFNPLFLRIVKILNTSDEDSNGLKKITNLNCLRLVDAGLANSLEHLMKYVELAKNYPDQDKEAIEVDNCTLKDLSLTFTLPGYPNYKLIPNGENTGVDASNVKEYISKVIEATLYTGIVPQTKAFMDGFSKVFPVNSLNVFSPEELADLFGSATEDWSYETVSDAIHANHGFNKESDAVKSLVDILVHLNDIEKRSFLQFLTGAPKLPIGGFKSLKPEFTVVRKYPEGGLKDDDYLPSVMTCANYLKLPNYSTTQVMKTKLMQAVNEGAGAFLLS